jgi:FAD:protein FMN transferase
MGVEARLVLFAPDETTARSAASDAFQRLAELDSIMSDYRSDSELMRLVATPHGRPVPIGDDLYAVLHTAQTLAEISGGAFDVTAGPLIRLWRQARVTGSLPDPLRLASARERTGWHYLRLDPVERTATLLAPAMWLDLGGIGKGYAVDQVLAALRERGIDRALVELGGDIGVSAPPPGEVAWSIRIADADTGHDFVDLANAAISSSGDTEQFVMIDGVRHSHVVDPRTGMGLTHNLLVTVTAPSATISDALSTLVGVLGVDASGQLISTHFPEAIVYVRHWRPESAQEPTPLEMPVGARQPGPHN